MGAVADHAASRGYILPAVAAAGAAPFDHAVQSGQIVFVSGQVSRSDAGVIKGPVEHLTERERKDAAHLAILRSLAALDAGLPEAVIVRRVLKLTCYALTLATTLDPAIFNPASELLVELYGGPGRHARTAVGIAATPFGAAIVIDLTVEV